VHGCVRKRKVKRHNQSQIAREDEVRRENREKKIEGEEERKETKCIRKGGKGLEVRREFELL
jgi:hypothetical protein